MIEHCFAVLLFFSAGLSLPAQKHGRADANTKLHTRRAIRTSQFSTYRKRQADCHQVVS